MIRLFVWARVLVIKTKNVGRDTILEAEMNPRNPVVWICMAILALFYIVAYLCFYFVLYLFITFSTWVDGVRETEEGIEDGMRVDSVTIPGPMTGLSEREFDEILEDIFKQGQRNEEPETGL